MLTISQSALAYYRKDFLGRFLKQITPALAERYPHFLPRFPESVQTEIVRNMVGRGARWGVKDLQALLAFAELMISVAANFDEEPNIRAVLQGAAKQQGRSPDEVVVSFTDLVPEAAWESAERGACDLPFFTPSHLLTATLLDRTTAAVPLVLFDATDLQNPRGVAMAGAAVAEELHLEGQSDAPLVMVAWRQLYGPKFNDKSMYPWVGDVLEANPRACLAMLKFRIALDHGRFV